MPDAIPVSLPPEEAIEFFRGKGYLLTHSWEDVAAEEHGRTFTVAKVARLDVLEDIRTAVDDALANGTTLEQFRRELTPKLQEAGWWGRKKVRDPLTGEEEEAQLGSPRRLATIYDTNLRTAYASGRWTQAQRTKDARPYMRYVAILDDGTRAQHRLWHGTVLPVDHDFWKAHWPPNGWQCRCSVRQLSQRDMERSGYKVTDPAPEAPTVPYQNGRTGEVRHVPRGIDPGFDWNAGVRGDEVAARVMGERLSSVSADIGAAAWEADRSTVLQPLQKSYSRWLDEVRGLPDQAGQSHPVGALSRSVVAKLRTMGGEAGGFAPAAAGIVVPQSAIPSLMKADVELGSRIRLLRELPTWLSRDAQAVLYDTAAKQLLYVYDIPEQPGERLMVQVARGPKARRKRGDLVANRVSGVRIIEPGEFADVGTRVLLEGDVRFPPKPRPKGR